MMLAHIQNMSAEQRTQLATAIGVTPDQLNQVAQTMAQMPPEMLAQMMAARGGAPGGPGAGGVPPGVTVVHLTAEEKAAVDRVRLHRLPSRVAHGAIVHTTVSVACLCTLVPAVRARLHQATSGGGLLGMRQERDVGGQLPVPKHGLVACVFKY